MEIPRSRIVRLEIAVILAFALAGYAAFRPPRQESPRYSFESVKQGYRTYSYRLDRSTGEIVRLDADAKVVIPPGSRGSAPQPQQSDSTKLASTLPLLPQSLGDNIRSIPALEPDEFDPRLSSAVRTLSFAAALHNEALVRLDMRIKELD